MIQESFTLILHGLSVQDNIILSLMITFVLKLHSSRESWWWCTNSMDQNEIRSADTSSFHLQPVTLKKKRRSKIKDTFQERLSRKIWFSIILTGKKNVSNKEEYWTRILFQINSQKIYQEMLNQRFIWAPKCHCSYITSRATNKIFLH